MATFPWKSALLTGASAGIGEAMAEQLGAAGIPTVVVARRFDRLEALAAKYLSITPLAADLQSDEGWATVEGHLRLHPVELLINNAGFGTSGEFVDIDIDRSVGEIELNVVSLVRLTRVAAETMKAAGRGWVLNVSSVAGFQSSPNLAVYAATKAFVTSFSEGIATELSPHGVKVTTLCPGLTKTEFQSVSNTTGFEAQFPDWLWATAETVAKAGLRDCAKGKVLSIPGAPNKLLANLSQVTPNIVTRRLSALATKAR
jgi:uncharacterized protein